MPKKTLYLDEDILSKIKVFSSLYEIKESQFVNLVMKKHFGDIESEILLTTYELAIKKIN